MGELALATRGAATDLAQRVRSPELTEQHRPKLAPAGNAARMPLGLDRDDGLLKLGARKALEQLTEDPAESRQGIALLADAVSRDVRQSATSCGAARPLAHSVDVNSDKSGTL